MRLAIIIGHTRYAQGAKAAKPINKTEYEFNSDLSIDLYRFAREAGIDCRIFKRDGVSRETLGRDVSKWGDVAIELHLNAFDTVVKGTETLYDALPVENAAFAELIHKKICESLGRTGKRDRGTKLVGFHGRGWLNLDAVTIPGCLVEPVFCDNSDESRLLYKHKLDYARALIDGVVEYLCIEKGGH